MPDKKVVQDIVSNGRRSIREVSRESSASSRPDRTRETEIKIHKSRSRMPADEESPNELPLRKKKPMKPKGSRRVSGTLIAFLVIFICLAVIAVAFSLLYSKAVVTITPKKDQFTVNGTFTAKKDTVATSTEISYQVLSINLSADQIVPATSGPLVQTKAKGTAYMYNAQTASQKIVAGTRLSNANGLIYRTVSTVTVPAGKTVSGKVTPGAISVDIIADQAGSSYNMTLGDLTGDLNVVAYKGEAKYTTVYGRIKTNVIGGYSGNKKIIASTLQTSTVQALESSLGTTLAAKLKAAVPAGYILYAGASTTIYQTPDPTSTSTNTADIVVNGTANGVIFRSDALLNYIAKNDLATFQVPNYTVKGLDALAFTVSNSQDFSAQKGTPLIFTLKGPISLEGTFSSSTLISQLRGISVNQSNAVFAKYPAISNAYALITPFWIHSFPNSADKITLEIKD